MSDSLRLDMSQVEGALADLHARAGNLAPVYPAISLILVRSVHKNFDVGGRYSSPGEIIGGTNKWAPPKYRESIVGGRGQAGQDRIHGRSVLLRSGLLQRSVQGASDAQAAWAQTNAIQAAILNLGGQTKAHQIGVRNAKSLRFLSGMVTVFARSVNHPGSTFDARPFMVVQEEDADTSKELFADYLLQRGSTP